MKGKVFLTFIVILMVVLVPDAVYAAAGGSIAKAITKSFWGKLIMGVVFLIFLPLIIWVYIKEYRAVKRTSKDLVMLASKSKVFDWLSIKMRVSEVFNRVQTAWDKNNIEEASEWMDDWYWQNQKYVHLSKWEEKGMKNIVNVKKINNIKPLYVNHSGEADAEGSRIVVSIDANMQDYLVRLSDNMVVEGDKEFKDVESVWTFVLSRGKWVVQNIEESSMSLTYAGMKNVLSMESLKPQRV